jgi:2-dehydro-3-deoxyphosphogluconate aldolase/(4S)-4-hydroxy-2-oxoglutarate aldolase
MNKYLSFPKVAAVGGTWLAKDDVIKSGNFDKITALATEAINTMLGFEFAHIGINSPDAETSLKDTKFFSSIFNFPLKEGNSSNFAGSGIEINKSQGLGTNGHIAIATNSINRAIKWIERQGIKVNYDTSKKDSKGELIAIYLEKEVAGFAIHLLQKK